MRQLALALLTLAADACDHAGGALSLLARWIDGLIESLSCRWTE